MTEDGGAAAARREAAAALLAADGKLRAAMAEGLALFALAAAQPTGTAVPTGENPALHGSPRHQLASTAACHPCWSQPHATLDSLYGAGALPHAASAQELADELLQEVAARQKQVLVL